jgi:hypothetical protein
VVAHKEVSVRATTPAAIAATPPHEEGTLRLFRPDPSEAAVKESESIEIRELKLRVDLVSIHITIEH